MPGPARPTDVFLLATGSNLCAASVGWLLVPEPSVDPHLEFPIIPEQGPADRPCVEDAGDAVSGDLALLFGADDQNVHDAGSVSGRRLAAPWPRCSLSGLSTSSMTFPAWSVMRLVYRSFSWS